jgi:hypothetical protein
MSSGNEVTRASLSGEKRKRFDDFCKVTFGKERRNCPACGESVPDVVDREDLSAEGKNAFDMNGGTSNKKTVGNQLNTNRRANWKKHLIKCQDENPCLWKDFVMTCPNRGCSANLHGFDEVSKNFHVQRLCKFGKGKGADVVAPRDSYCSQCKTKFKGNEDALLTRNRQLFCSHDCVITYNKKHELEKSRRRKERDGDATIKVGVAGLMYENRLNRQVTAEENAFVRQLDNLVCSHSHVGVLACAEFIVEYAATLKEGDFTVKEEEE